MRIPLFFLAFAFPVLALAEQFLPVDEATQRPSFFSFRANLVEALARHDVDAVLAVVSPDVKNGFGGNDGIEAFRATWKLDGGDSAFWHEMARVLALGGTFDDAGNFVAPYVYSEWPQEFDAFNYVAVVGSRVSLREAPHEKAKVVATANFEILEHVPSKQETDAWMRVRREDGTIGFIARAYAQSPVGYRAMFRETNGRWQLVFFVAGD